MESQILHDHPSPKLGQGSHPQSKLSSQTNNSGQTVPDTTVICTDNVWEDTNRPTHQYHHRPPRVTPSTKMGYSKNYSQNCLCFKFVTAKALCTRPVCTHWHHQCPLPWATLPALLYPSIVATFVVDNTDGGVHPVKAGLL